MKSFRPRTFSLNPWTFEMCGENLRPTQIMWILRAINWLKIFADEDIWALMLLNHVSMDKI